jgi:pimeloyl-ACP methyl ester carboxylesterase
VPKVRTLDDRAAEIEAVMDAAGFRKAVVFGLSDGGFASIVIAQHDRSERGRLILYGTVPCLGFAGWDDMDRDLAELRARHLPELGEDYSPSTEQLARLQE